MKRTHVGRGRILLIRLAIAIGSWIGPCLNLQAEEEGDYHFTRIGETVRIDSYQGTAPIVTLPRKLANLPVVPIL